MKRKIKYEIDVICPFCKGTDFEHFDIVGIGIKNIYPYSKLGLLSKLKIKHSLYENGRLVASGKNDECAHHFFVYCKKCDEGFGIDVDLDRTPWAINEKIEVEYDEELKVPLSFVFRSRRFEVLKVNNITLRVSRMSPFSEISGFNRDRPFGNYRVQTEDGWCEIEAVPREDKNGNYDFSKVDWLLFDADFLLKSKLLSRKGGIPSERFLKGIQIERRIKEGEEISLDAYKLIYRLENRLRKLISDRLLKKYGEKWWDKAISADIRIECREKRRCESNIKWFEEGELPPIYYTTFTNLKTIIETCWDDIFGPLLKPRDIFRGKFKFMELVRNRIAHNRSVDKNTLLEFQKDVDKIITCLKE